MRVEEPRKFVYVDVRDKVRLGRVAPAAPALGPMLSARHRRDAERGQSRGDRAWQT